MSESTRHEYASETYWNKKECPLETVPAERGPMITNNNIPSERIHVYYKKNFMSAWRLSGDTIYTTDHGAITEIPYTDLKKLIKKQGYGYVPQQAWLLNDTLRNNILFGSEYDNEKYNEVIRVCSLSRDLTLLLAGD